jgi:hypothetical protein
VGPVREIEAERQGIDINEPGALEKAEAEGKIQIPSAAAPASNGVEKME